jgi:PIN domain nuclease of toxin-antitoxin system
MKLLVDTHVLFWALSDQSKLSAVAALTLKNKDNEVYVSVATAWELAIKVGLGKWPEARPLIEGFDEEIERVDFRLLPILVVHARSAGMMILNHKDPFDRLLVAQAIVEGLVLVTSDAKLSGMGAPTIW